MIELNVSKLNKRFGNNLVLNNIDVNAASCVLGVAGSNGSGKSTFLKCISGLLKPTSGQVNWSANGTPIKEENIKKSIGFAAPYIQYYEELTILENLNFIIDLNETQDHLSIDELLDRVGMKSFSEKLYGELSTGQQQRVKLAGALIHKPSILILDEPGSNLDEKGRKIIEEIVSEHKKLRGMVVLASNQQHELDMCDNILHLQSEAK